jgi:hypothetical protein
MITDEEIQATFYNIMLEIMLSSYNPAYVKTQFQTNKNEFIKAITIDTFKFMFNRSEKIHLSNGQESIGFYTINSQLITLENVSGEYKLLFSGLINHLTVNSDTSQVFNGIVSTILNKPSFKTIIEKVIKFHGETISTNQVVLPVTVEAIRETFYNIMAEQYYLNKSVEKSDLESAESHIFFALSGYAILAVALNSKGIDGVRLVNGGIVKKQNCPQMFKQLFDALLVVKAKLESVQLNHDEENYILETVSMKPDEQRTTLHLNPSAHIKQISSQISEITIKISQNQHFKEVIGPVLDFLIN